MREIQWQLKETFAFPTAAGKPTGAEIVQVTPRYTVDRSEDSVRLTGIYHIAANVSLNEEIKEENVLDSAILIDDIEVETGYFEYAAPFNIDLPPEASDPLKMVTLNAKHEIDEEGHFSVVWDVQCSYKEVVVIMEQEDQAEAKAEEVVVEVEADTTVKTEAKVEKAPVISVAKHESTSFNNDDEALSFIAGLDDGISTTLFRSNDILVKSES